MVCNKCKEDKPLSGYQKDYRREGLPSFHQQPCADCRNAQKRLKRRIDIGSGYLPDSVFSSSFIRRGTNLTPFHVDRPVLDVYKAKFVLDREIGSVGIPHYTGDTIFCTYCESLVYLPKECSVQDLIDILCEFNKQHIDCAGKYKNNKR